MSIKVMIGALIVFIIAVILLRKYRKQKEILDSSQTIEGYIEKYRRSYKYLYPTVKFIDDETEKSIELSGMVNFKLIKEGTKIRILKLSDNKYLTDYDLKLAQVYVKMFFCAAILLGIIGFMFVQ